jgi:hypothetical protein
MLPLDLRRPLDGADVTNASAVVPTSTGPRDRVDDGALLAAVEDQVRRLGRRSLLSRAYEGIRSGTRRPMWVALVPSVKATAGVVPFSFPALASEDAALAPVLLGSPPLVGPVAVVAGACWTATTLAVVLRHRREVIDDAAARRFVAGYVDAIDRFVAAAGRAG